MLTLDQFLISLIDSNRIDTIPYKDKKILISLRQQLKRQYFLTEKQGNLLVKLLYSNKKKIDALHSDEENLINDPKWSQNFRIVFPVRKIYFSDENMTKIVVECINEKEIKQKLASHFMLANRREILSSSSSQLILHANEYNVVRLIDLLKDDNFDIDDAVLDIYEKVKDIIDNSEDPLNLFHLRNIKLLDLIAKEAGEDSDKNLIYLDRRLRYQYNYVLEEKNSLSYKIANRSNINVWLNEAICSLADLFDALQELKRFPVLFVFDPYSVDKCYPILLKLNEALESTKIEKKVGIYFRFENNNEQHKTFNQLVSSLKFNSYLDETTNVVGISSKNLPKFLFKSNWYPKTVITNISNFQKTKSFRYCDQVDLIISYTLDQPLLEGKFSAIV